MQKVHLSAKVALVMLLPFLMSACTSAPRGSNLLADAYSTPGIMKAKPYTRTIFSTTDF